MSEYKAIRIKNKNLSEKIFERACERMSLLERYVGSAQNQPVVFTGKSTKKIVYSVDCGADTTECNGFVSAITFYLGSDRDGVEIY